MSSCTNTQSCSIERNGLNANCSKYNQNEGGDGKSSCGNGQIALVGMERYVKGDTLGEGTFGVVVKAIDKVVSHIDCVCSNGDHSLSSIPCLLITYVLSEHVTMMPI